MLKIATAASEEPDAAEAVEEVIEIAEEQLGDTVPQAALVFASIDVDLPEMVAALRARYPGIEVAGCTTDGELADPDGFLEDSLVVTFFASDSVDFTVGVGHGAGATPDKAAADAVAMAKAKTDKDAALCISLPEGIGTNIHTIVESLRAALGDDFPVVGGAAGDQLRFKGTSQICNDEIVSDAIVVMLLSGPLIYSTGVATGYKPLGERHVVTRAEGSTIHEIDGRPAVELYKEYVQAQSIFFPLAVHEPGRENFLLSSPQQFDEESGSIHFVNPVPQDREVQIATASREEIVDASRTAIREALAAFAGDKPEAALVFSCAGRRAALGTRTVEEYEAFEDIAGRDFPTAGFYTYGEIGPARNQGKSYSHTNAFLTVLLGTPQG